MPKIKIPSIVFSLAILALGVFEALANQSEQHQDIVDEVAKQLSNLNQK